MNRVADFGVTNVTLDAGQVITPEDMNSNIKMILLPDGGTTFVYEDEDVGE